MAIVEGWLPPSRQNWELICNVFQFFPVVTILQWTISWYGMGKTSVESRLNLPGKIGWFTMEAPGFLILIYIVNTLPAEVGLTELPWENKIMAALFIIHYIYRALLYPLLAPSISPIHILVWAMAVAFQVLNGLSIGGWLGGYGPTTRSAWATPTGPNHTANPYLAGARMEAGLMIWALGFILTVFHDDELREIRRAAARREHARHQHALRADADVDEPEENHNPKTIKNKTPPKNNNNNSNTNKKKNKKTSTPPPGLGVHKFYQIPHNGFFRWILYPHYICEWLEWTGYWLMGGGIVGVSGVVGGAEAFRPGRTFLLNEIATMVPRALQGGRWYRARFGVERLGGRTALVPGLL